MVNVGLLTAEICWWVWGTPANFSGFRVLAALLHHLHGILVVGVSKTLRHWTEGATYIRQGGHHVGHWPTLLVRFNSQQKMRNATWTSIFKWKNGFDSRSTEPPYRRFPDNHFPGQTFAEQVILRNFHVHNVCKYQLYRRSPTICRYTERLVMCTLVDAYRPEVSIWGPFGKACSPPMDKT